MQGADELNRIDDDAIVLSSTESGESDLILTFLSRRYGRFSAVAKGARKSRRRFVNKLEIFTLLHVSISRKSPTALAFLHEAELVTIYPTLRTNYNAYLGASVLREVLLHTTRDGERDPKLFRLTLWALYRLDQHRPPAEPVTLFLLHALNLLGYRPGLSHCTACGRKATTLPMRFDCNNGGLLCASCSRTPIRIPLSKGCLTMLSTAQTMPVERLSRLRPAPAALGESLAMLHRFIRHILQRDLNSWPAFAAVCSSKKR